MGINNGDENIYTGRRLERMQGCQPLTRTEFPRPDVNGWREAGGRQAGGEGGAEGVIQDRSGQTPPPREGGTGLEHHYYAAGSDRRRGGGVGALGSGAACGGPDHRHTHCSLKGRKMEKTAVLPSYFPLCASLLHLLT